MATSYSTPIGPDALRGVIERDSQELLAVDLNTLPLLIIFISSLYFVFFGGFSRRETKLNTFFKAAFMLGVGSAVVRSIFFTFNLIKAISNGDKDLRLPVWTNMFILSLELISAYVGFFFIDSFTLRPIIIISLGSCLLYLLTSEMLLASGSFTIKALEGRNFKTRLLRTLMTFASVSTVSSVYTWIWPKRRMIAESHKMSHLK